MWTNLSSLSRPVYCYTELNIDDPSSVFLWSWVHRAAYVQTKTHFTAKLNSQRMKNIAVLCCAAVNYTELCLFYAQLIKYKIDVYSRPNHVSRRWCRCPSAAIVMKRWHAKWVISSRPVIIITLSCFHWLIRADARQCCDVWRCTWLYFSA